MPDLWTTHPGALSVGLQSGSEMQTLMARIFTIYYFAFFLLMPLWTRWDSYKPVPERVTTHD